MSLSSFEVLYNNTYGGFSFNEEFLKMCKLDINNEPDRYNQDIIAKVKEFGLKESSGRYCKFKIAKISYDSRILLTYIQTHINTNEYDGLEHISIYKSKILCKMIDDKIFTNLEELYEMKQLIKDIKIDLII